MTHIYGHDLDFDYSDCETRYDDAEQEQYDNEYDTNTDRIESIREQFYKV